MNRKNPKKQFENELWSLLNRRCINGSKLDTMNKKSSSYIKNKVELKITRDELKNIIEKNWEKICEIRKNGLKPSIDRIGPSVHYEMGNIQFISINDNIKKKWEKYRFNNPDMKEKAKEKQREYYIRNKEKLKEYNKEYYLKNKEKIKEYRKEYNKEYYLKNKEKIKEYDKKRYISKKGN